MGLRSSGPLEVPREKKWGWVMWGGGSTVHLSWEQQGAP